MLQKNREKRKMKRKKRKYKMVGWNEIDDKEKNGSERRSMKDIKEKEKGKEEIER